MTWAVGSSLTTILVVFFPIVCFGWSLANLQFKSVNVSPKAIFTKWQSFSQQLTVSTWDETSTAGLSEGLHCMYCIVIRYRTTYLLLFVLGILREQPKDQIRRRTWWMIPMGAIHQNQLFPGPLLWSKENQSLPRRRKREGSDNTIFVTQQWQQHQMTTQTETLRLLHGDKMTILREGEQEARIRSVPYDGIRQRVSQFCFRQ